MRTTDKDVKRALETLVRAASAAGYPLPAKLDLQLGCKANGIAYRLYESTPGYNIRPIHMLGLPAQYLGMTAAEAHETLLTLANLLFGIAYVNDERARAAKAA